MKLDFEHWSRLAREAPEEFERCRAAAIDELIARAAPERRPMLRALQGDIDAQRRKAPTPLAAALQLQHMLAEQLARLTVAFEHLAREAREGASATGAEQPARVLPFVRRGGPRDCG